MTFSRINGTKVEIENQPQVIHSSFHGVHIECVAGDISQQPDIAAVVNVSKPQFLHGIDGIDKSRFFAALIPGVAVLDSGGAPGKPHVIHCLAPIYGVDEPASELLANCYRNALRLADAHGIESVAFPAISIGTSQYPFAEATDIACWIILQTIPALTEVKRIRLVFTSLVSATTARAILNQQIPE